MPLDFVTLAAGIGSRFGGDKQVEGFGPDGETLIEINAFDAIRAGADALVWVTRADLSSALEGIAARVRGQVPVRLVYQSTTLDPAQKRSAERSRPWGTAHAWMAGFGDAPVRPMLVANADDLYGADAFDAVCTRLLELATTETVLPHCVAAGFRVCETLSPIGGVSRARIEHDGEGNISGVTELQDVRRARDGAIRGTTAAGESVDLPDDALVSMNLWGFDGDWRSLLKEALARFSVAAQSDEGAEFRIPDVVLDAIHGGVASGVVVPVASTWAGVTFPEDRSHLEATLLEGFRSGTYPSPLFPTS